MLARFLEKMINKSKLIILVFIFGTLVELGQAQNKEIFRYVDFGKNQRIFLGQNFLNSDNLFDKTEIGYKTKPNSFGTTTLKNVSIIVSNNKIKAIYFDYHFNRNIFEQKIVNYSKVLGSPTDRISLNSNSIKIEVVYWEDKQTRFELVKKTEREETSLSSGMFDKLLK